MAERTVSASENLERRIVVFFATGAILVLGLVYAAFSVSLLLVAGRDLPAAAPQLGSLWQYLGVLFLLLVAGSIALWRALRSVTKGLAGAALLPLALAFVLTIPFVVAFSTTVLTVMPSRTQTQGIVSFVLFLLFIATWFASASIASAFAVAVLVVAVGMLLASRTRAAGLRIALFAVIGAVVTSAAAAWLFPGRDLESALLLVLAKSGFACLGMAACVFETVRLALNKTTAPRAAT